MEKEVEDRWTTLSSFAVAGLWAAVLLYSVIHVQRMKNARIIKPSKSSTVANHRDEIVASDVAGYQRAIDEGPQFCAHDFYDV
jgi:hypothetical protein